MWQLWFHCPVLATYASLRPPPMAELRPSSLPPPDCMGCPGLGTSSLAMAPYAMVQPGISTFKVSHSYNRCRQGLLNALRYHRQSQECPRPLLHKTSPGTLQQTPFLYRALLGNALKIFLSATQENCLISFIFLLVTVFAPLSTSGIGIHLANQPEQ